MALSRQIQANGANAKKSTGPRSKAGKAHSRRNALKHGLTAETLIIGGEVSADFDGLRAALIEQHHPRTQIEAELVERMAALLWRLRRVPFFEAAILDARLAQAEMNASGPRRCNESGEEEEEEMSDAEWRLHVGDAMVWDSLGNTLGNLGRHETTLTNNLTKTLQMLLAIQEMRAESEGKRLSIDAVATEEAQIRNQVH